MDTFSKNNNNSENNNIENKNNDSDNFDYEVFGNFSHWLIEDSKDKESKLGYDILEFYENRIHIKFYNVYRNIEHIFTPVRFGEPSLNKLSDIKKLFDMDYDFSLFTEIYRRYGDVNSIRFINIVLIDEILFWAIKAMKDYSLMLIDLDELRGIYRSFDDIEFFSSFLPDNEDKFMRIINDLKLARSSKEADIELNPGPVCYKMRFNELQMKTDWLNKWNESWEILSDSSNKTYKLKLFFPHKNLTFISQAHISKKNCEEDCFAQLYNYYNIVPQSGLIMQQGELKAQDEEIENTILTTTQEKVIIPEVTPNVNENILSEDSFKDPSLVGVAYWLTRFTWDDATSLTEMIVPKILFQSGDSAFAPIAKAFQVHSVYRVKGSFIFKPVSNKFNSGILGITWFPLFNQLSEASRNSRKNKYSLSQLPTQYINACTGNEVQVDFDNFYPVNYVSSSNRNFMLPDNDIGSLLIYPLNPLSIGETGSKWCDINVFVKFTELEFIGKIDQRINPQSGLKDSLISAGKSILNSQTMGASNIVFDLLDSQAKKKSSNGNADFPVDPSPGNFIIPNFLPSFSTTTNLSQPINSLGLDPSAMVTHKYPIHDDFSEICKVRSLFRQITFDVNTLPSAASY